MESRTRILILCLLYIARTSEVLAEEIEFGTRLSKAGDIKDLRLDTLIQETHGTDSQSVYKLRDKRALGLLLSGLAQIFGYSVTPIQIASLPNPTNISRPATMSSSSMMGNVMRQQAASTQPMSMNVTIPRQQETIRFTGVLNFGNNSDIVGHLQRYEQIFHGRQNNTTDTMMTTNSRPASVPMPPAIISMDPRTNSATKPPLLAPFFVRIPLPIAPDLPPATMPIENFRLSYPAPAISFASESNKTVETPVRKEQETIYKNNKNTERYTVEEKDIYDEKDVMKPVNHNNHQLYVEPSSQQDGKQQRKQEERVERLKEQEERVERLKEQEEQRNCDKNKHKEDEIKEKGRNREEEIVNRNREHASKHESTRGKKPAYDDEENEDSAEEYEERTNQANKSSKQPLRENDSEKVEDDDPDEQIRGDKQPENFDKYVEVGYNQELPIGDYFHEGDPEVIRDSYGEILDNKKLEDDRISGYISMFKHPYVYVRDPEDASGGNKKSPTIDESAVDGYNKHLARLQRLREEYAIPKNKYEEYDLNDDSEANREDSEANRDDSEANRDDSEANRDDSEANRDDSEANREDSEANREDSEANRDDRDNKRTQNRTSMRSKTERTRGKQDHPVKTSSRLSENILRDDVAKSQEEIDFARHIPVIVPIRYIDMNDKMQQATTRQLSYEESDKRTSGRFSEDNVDPTPVKGKLIPQIGLPERSRKLHEGEYKELQVWPPPFDYAFDNTAPTNAVISPNPQDYPSNYYQHVQNIAANDASSDNSSDEPSGYLVVVGNSIHPYRYPYNVYYFPNDNANSQNQAPHVNTEDNYSRDQDYIPQQNANQQLIRANSNLTEYNLNETTRDRYQQPHEAPINILDRYRYIYDERTPEAKESVNMDMRGQVPNVENWSSRLYQSRSRAQQSPPVLAHLQKVAPSNDNVQGRPSNSRYSRPIRRQERSSQPEELRKDEGKVKIPPPISTSKPFEDPQSAHDFFGFNKDDYSFAGESSDAKVAEENGKIMKEEVSLDPVVYHHDNESVVKHADEIENDTKKAKVTEYRNKVTTLKISEQRQLTPNGPIYHVDFIRNI